MSDFTSSFWSFYISVITVASIAGCVILLAMTGKKKVAGSQTQTTGHIWDEDMGEFNNPLPMWWVGLFYVTIVFSAIYLALYPGLGSFAGLLHWSSAGQYDVEAKQAESEYGPIYARFAKIPLVEVVANPEARAIGQKLFLNNCSRCHGSDAAGGNGFPNLTDQDWLYGGDPETIKTTIMNGRNGVMPAWGPVLGEEGVKDAANYVRSLSGLANDSTRAARGKEKFMTMCAACHGPEGRGNQALGAPNLTDNIWLYGSSEAKIIATITNGRGTNSLVPGVSAMPSHKDSLGEEKVHILAAYVYSLSNPQLRNSAGK